MARRYLVSPLPPPGEHALPQDVAHHVVHVMRQTSGSTVVLFDGSGREADATLTAARRREARAKIGPSRAVHRGPTRVLHLAVALPKGPRADWLLEHGTEIGVAAFHPLLTARSAARRGEIPARWHRILAAAAGQCDRSHLPALHDPVPLLEFLARSASLPITRILADGEGPSIEPAPADGAVLLVGPEGGMTPNEIVAANAAGFAARSLGPLTLRTETAALVGAARLLG